MDEPMQVSGIVTGDPAISSAVGTVLHFAPALMTNNFEERVQWLQQWQSFEGCLLLFLFKNAEKEWVDGSGVMVAPGIALCAAHVFTEHLEQMSLGLLSASAMAITSHGLQIWAVRKVTVVTDSDLAIVGFEAASEIPSGNTYHLACMTTRLPKIGERLSVAGFRPEGEVHLHGHSGRVLVSVGKVSERYVTGRDSVTMPWPVLELDCPSWGGMSGGPVFTDDGHVVGILSSSMTPEEDGPSYVSLIWPAITVEFEGGWPAAVFTGKTSLLDLNERLCFIDKRSALIREETSDGQYTTRYAIWE